MTTKLLRRLFTVTEYNRMVEAGILTKDDRVELIRGEIIQMSPIGRRHAAAVNRLVRIFTERLGDCIVLAPQNPVELDNHSEPQPDIALLHPRADFYESGHPTQQDVFLLVEVADSTIAFDRSVKVALYAEGNLNEVWLVDVTGQYIEVYRQSDQTGYQQQERFYRGQTVAMQAFPDVEFAIESILG
jgi:Uma2 family endonuclease